MEVDSIESLESLDLAQELSLKRDELRQLDYQIAKSKQSILLNLDQEAVNLREREKYDYFLSLYGDQLIKPQVVGHEAEIVVKMKGKDVTRDEEIDNLMLNGKEFKESGENGTAKSDKIGSEMVVVARPMKKMGPGLASATNNLHNFYNETEDEHVEMWVPPPYSIPITTDVRTFDFKGLARCQKEVNKQLYDVILTDPPWQLTTNNPTRGVALGYNQLSDEALMNVPFADLQDDGLLFIWIINAKYEFALKLMEKNGYKLIDEIVWAKATVNRRVARSHGFYLQHGKEACLVFQKGKGAKNMQYNVDHDILFARREGQSQKPVEIYELIEKIVPNGHYLEIFGRRNNLRNFWTTIGNEL